MNDEQFPMRDRETSWAAAEAVAREHASRHGAPNRVVRHASIPYYFDLAYDHGWVWLLVHAGRVVTETGIEALGTYLRDVGVAVRKAMTAEDMVLLIEHFSVLPPVQGHEPAGFYRDAALPALAPALVWRDSGACLLLCYVEHATGPGGGVPGDMLAVERWALVMPARDPLAWVCNGSYWYRRDGDRLERRDA